MKKERDDANATRCPGEELLPLLEAVMRGMRERTDVLAQLERRITRLETGGEASALVAQAARHRRELQTTRRELARIGCSLLSRSRLAV